MPARVETVVLFLPDVWSCSPTRLEWQATAATLHSELETKLASLESADDDGDGTESKALSALFVVHSCSVAVPSSQVMCLVLMCLT